MTKRKLNLIIAWQLIISCLFLCGWTYTLKTNTPAGGDDPTEADDRMREIKGAFVERLDKNHYYTRSATSTYDAADTGKHRYITFRDPNDLTSMAADESALFSKDVSSVTELHWIDESDNVLQMTSGGTLNIVSADLLGTLANATYFTAVDNAGTGTVDLIKADVNDVAVVPDNSQTATNAAPTSSTGIANKKYVDDHSGTIKAWVNFTPRDDAGAVTINDNFNVSGVVRNGTGDYTVSWDTDFTGTDYAVFVTVQGDNGAGYIAQANGGVKTGTSLSMGSVTIIMGNTITAAADDMDLCFVMAIGS